MSGAIDSNDWEWAPLRPLRYRVVYADPAWEYETWSDQGQGRAPPYPTMSDAEIAALTVADLAADRCLLAMWTTSSKLKVAFDILDAWGARYATVGFVWVKTNPSGVGLHTGMGHYTRLNAEYCLFGVIGRPPTRLDKSVHQIIKSPVRDHSRKPAEARTRLERLVGGPRCELFAQYNAPGWDVWGNQTDLFKEP